MLNDEYGNNVLSTPESRDLPSSESVSFTDVGTHYIGTDIYSVEAVHAYQTDEYNSIHPTMVEFYPECSATDKVPPVITQAGNNPLILYQNAPYIDPGAIAFDNLDGELTSSIVVGGDFVDTSVFGMYVVTYDVRDSSGNAASQISRTVVVTLGDETTFVIK